jgi:type IV pilus assembly protein PilM
MKVSGVEVSTCLPPTKVVTRVVQTPLMNENELASSINWEAEQYIPWPLSKVKLDYVIVEEDAVNQKMLVQLVAAPTDLIAKYTRIISLAGLTPVSMETELLAIERSMKISNPTLKNVIVFSFGATTTEIGILHNHILIHTKSFPIGGATLTQAIAQELGFEIAQAEEYKKTYGLEEDKLEGKIAKIINPFLNNLYSEVEKMIAFFKEQYPKEELTNIVVCGGSAKLPNIMSSLTMNLGLDCQVANPFVNLEVDPKILPIVVADGPLYTTAVGLALKETD